MSCKDALERRLEFLFFSQGGDVALAEKLHMAGGSGPAPAFCLPPSTEWSPRLASIPRNRWPGGWLTARRRCARWRSDPVSGVDAAGRKQTPEHKAFDGSSRREIELDEADAGAQSQRSPTYRWCPARMAPAPLATRGLRRRRSRRGRKIPASCFPPALRCVRRIVNDDVWLAI